MKKEGKRRRVLKELNAPVSEKVKKERKDKQMIMLEERRRKNEQTTLDTQSERWEGKVITST